MKLENIELTTLEKIAKDHVQMFGNRVTAARQEKVGFRLDECLTYLTIWKRILNKTKKSLVDNKAPIFSMIERGELWDMIASGDYEELFAIK